MGRQTVVVVGLGEVGKPLMELLSPCHQTIGVDIDPVSLEITRVDVMHLCFPFQVHDFVGEAVRYIHQFRPALTVINSTVGIGTTRRIAERSGMPVVNSPVRGKHAKMLDDMRSYVKFIGALRPEDGAAAARHFEAAGLSTRILSSPEATELAKLTETTYFGVMIAWAQELERYCDRTGASYDEVTAFYEEISFFPAVKYFPGVIGGHCVMPNIEILQREFSSEILEAVRSSNEMKVARDARIKAEALSRELQPL